MNKFIVFVVIIATFLVSCKSLHQTHVPAQVPIQYKERIVEKLVPVRLPDDSLNVWALFECDSNNQVLLKQLNEAKSKGVESNFSFNNGALNYNAKAIHDTIYLPAKDSIIYKEVPVRVEVPVEVNVITGWQYTQIYAGRLLLTILLIYGIYRFIKWKLKR